MKLFVNFIPLFVALLILQTPAFAHHKGWHKNGPPKHAQHHHKHGDHDGQSRDGDHQHEHHDQNSSIKIDLPATPQIAKPEICVKGICLSSK